MLWRMGFFCMFMPLGGKSQFTITEHKFSQVVEKVKRMHAFSTTSLNKITFTNRRGIHEFRYAAQR
jgi:hypothetical protein